MKPYFHAGQRVVCIDASPNPRRPGVKLLSAGKIYVVRAADLGEAFGGWKPDPWWGVHIEGVRNLHPTGVDWAFNPARFRPVTGRPTDITVFREILAGRPVGGVDPAAPPKARPARRKLNNVEGWMRMAGLPMTRETFVTMTWFGEVDPDDLPPELEAELPEWARRDKQSG